MRPIDADDVIERLDMICDAGGCLSPVTKAVRSFCKGLINNQPTIEAEPDKGWISVKDRLPDENQKCLVYRDIDNDLKITTGIWHSDRKTFDGLCHGTRLENTIAWMPLPEPPKDGDSE